MPLEFRVERVVEDPPAYQSEVENSCLRLKQHFETHFDGCLQDFVEVNDFVNFTHKIANWRSNWEFTREPQAPGPVWRHQVLQLSHFRPPALPENSRSKTQLPQTGK